MCFCPIFMLQFVRCNFGAIVTFCCLLIVFECFSANYAFLVLNVLYSVALDYKIMLKYELHVKCVAIHFCRLLSIFASRLIKNSGSVCDFLIFQGIGLIYNFLSSEWSISARQFSAYIWLLERPKNCKGMDDYNVVPVAAKK